MGKAFQNLSEIDALLFLSNCSFFSKNAPLPLTENFFVLILLMSHQYLYSLHIPRKLRNLRPTEFVTISTQVQVQGDLGHRETSSYGCSKPDGAEGVAQTSQPNLKNCFLMAPTVLLFLGTTSEMGAKERNLGGDYD